MQKKKKGARAAVQTKRIRSASEPAPKKNTIGVTPLGDRVLVQPIAPDQVTSFGLIIPDTAKEKPEQGMVVAVGPGKVGDDNKRVPLGVSVGDRVMFSKYGFDELTVGGVEYYLVREDSILAIINR